MCETLIFLSLRKLNFDMEKHGWCQFVKMSNKVLSDNTWLGLKALSFPLVLIGVKFICFTKLCYCERNQTFLAASFKYNIKVVD